MQRSLVAVLVGTFTLRLSTGMTGALLAYYLDELPRHGGDRVEPIVVGAYGATFFAAELILSPFFGPLADRWGYHRVMQFGPVFGAIAVVLTGLTANLLLLGSTRLFEGASTAASVPSILGYIAIATALDEQLRGRVVARFEAATLAGLGAGLVLAGPLYNVFGPAAFFLNAGIYGVSFLIYRLGVVDPRSERPRPDASPNFGLRRYRALLASSHVWLLAPTWIAINAALGLWTTQTIFVLVRRPEPRFVDQMLMGGFDRLAISGGLAVGLLIFFAGLLYWGNRFKSLRRTSIIFYGIAGGAVLVLAAMIVNHSGDLPPVVPMVFGIAAVAGLFVLAGATPAALGLLADISERYPHDRGAIMGLYSVFLAVGQISGSLIGGAAAELKGIDGLLIATLGLLAVALIPLYRLRRYEHEVGLDAQELEQSVTSSS
ncbi:MAG TPA: MFS transporter [Candidatus Saccharimonadales bacterium]|nr:MFS transporter [Candidatus Saccharimonadales bacterium]